MKNFLYYCLTSVCTLLLLAGCESQAQNKQSKNKNTMSELTKTTVTEPITTVGTEVATLANGCFWCTEAVFQNLEGVIKVESGYTDGQVENPTYKAVCTGTTGHAECLQITYNPKEISFDELLEIFFNTHDATTLNRQGNDVGTQYRSGIYYHNASQKQLADAYIKQLETSKVFSNPIVTEVKAFSKFYKAEDYHQNYFNQNGEQPYCQFVVRPKVEKFKKQYADKLKKKN